MASEVDSEYQRLFSIVVESIEREEPALRNRLRSNTYTTRHRVTFRRVLGELVCDCGECESPEHACALASPVRRFVFHSGIECGR